MNLERHLTPVLSDADELGRDAARWAGVLSERAGEQVPYAFALAVARHHGRAPVVRSEACAPRAMSSSHR